MSLPKPRFTHDCKVCRFVGFFSDYDLYICPQGGNPTLVARFSNKGPDYLSGQRFVVDGVILELSAMAALELTS